MNLMERVDENQSDTQQIRQDQKPKIWENVGFWSLSLENAFIWV